MPMGTVCPLALQMASYLGGKEFVYSGLIRHLNCPDLPQHNNCKVINGV